MYTKAQEKALGLTPRERVGPRWVDAGTLAWGDLNHEKYPYKVRQLLGVKNQIELAELMEEGFGRDGRRRGSGGVGNESDPSWENAVRVIES